nr:immunoglobulin light chain junction region [Macaca mulatta]
CMQPLRFPWTF